MAVIRIRDQQSPLQHVYVAAEVDGCELETLIGALHGNMMFKASRAGINAHVQFTMIGPSESLAEAVAAFKAMCAAPAVNEAPPSE